MNCLRTGGECGYTDNFVSFAGSSTETVAPAEPAPARRTGGHRSVIKLETPSPSDAGQGQITPYRPPPQDGYILQDMTPSDPLMGLELSGPLTKLPAASRWLFHTCKHPVSEM